MLVRAAGRKQRRHTSRQLAEDFQQLYLPFLCPAQLRWSASRAVATHTGIRKTVSTREPEKQQLRSLASIAGATDYTPLTRSTPYDSSSQSPSLNWNYSRSEPPRAHQLLILKHNREEPLRTPTFKNGIGGNSADLLQNLYTCLRVSRFERAETIIQRLADQANTSESELIHAHEAYLNARFQELSMAPGLETNWQTMKAWFDDEVVAKNVDVGSQAYLAMIRAASKALDGPDCAKMVNQLADMSGLPREFLTQAPELEQDEWLRLGELLGEDRPDMEEALALESEANARALANAALYSLPHDNLPSVLEVKQKGMGLKSLKQGLQIFENESVEEAEAAHLLSPEASKIRAQQRERMIEESAAAAALMRWQAEEEHLRSIGMSGSLQSRPLGAMMWQWYSALLPTLKEELGHIRKALGSDKLLGSENEERRMYGAHLESVPLETIAATTILTIMQLITRGKDRDAKTFTAPMKLTMVTNSIGRQMQLESNAEAIKKHAAAVRKNVPRGISKREQQEYIKRQAQQSLYTRSLEWPISIKVKIGAMLVSKLIETAQLPISRQNQRTKETVTQIQPAFMHKTIYKLGKKQGYLVPSPDLMKKVHREPLGDAICKRLPMVVEPLPWTGFFQGGYLNYATPFIRFPPSDSTPRDYAIAAIDKGDMNQVFDALNILSRIPWKMNEDVLRVQIEAWNSGEAVGNFAPLDPQINLPPEPAASSDPNARRQWLTDVREMENKRSGFHSQRCHQNFQLEIARAFSNEVTYFPHNIDFRGRAYPIPPYLNHMGADNARALMQFAKGKELGTTGLRWLKIHVANVFGYDKASLQEREDFAMQHLPEIYDSANDPLSGRRWWLKSDDAWQTLAACFELKNALDSPDPTKFVSHLPIHQDGTCNGLQHYAALGGDEIGARQVNLEPSDRPSDVYTAVAESVKAEVEKDFHAGNLIAKVLHGHITRRVVKQPVMTNVYGVTYYGAKEQVKRQLEEIFPDIPSSAIINHTTLAAYTAKKIFKSLGEMFRGAQAIQEWLGTCADRISTCVTPEQIAAIREPPKVPKSASAIAKAAKRAAISPSIFLKRSSTEYKNLFRSSVIWTTPLRLPVVQPYRSSKRQTVKTSMQTIALQEPQAWDPVSKRKQLQGFPPNFIHSLDATHMMLSALKSDEKGMTFASIHDSFWTHACDIDELSTVLRDAFVHMHSEDIVGRLREEFSARYQDSMYLASVDLNSPVGKKIKTMQMDHARGMKKADKTAFASSPQADLMLEWERLQLLKSEDPKERKRGEEMVTPGSLFAAQPDESAFAVPNEIFDAKLGSVPYKDEAASELNSEAAETAEPVLEEELEEEPEEDLEDAEEQHGHQEQQSMPIKHPNMTDQNVRQALLYPDANNTEEAKRLKVKAQDAKRRERSRKVYIWLPLTFPAVPEKGTFDVRRLKQSRYFFH